MKRIRGFCLGFLIVILLFPYGVWATTYYVDATNGNDNNDGFSPSTAWKTIAKVNNSSFYPGDQILFNRDEIWREQLTVPSSGTEGSPIVIGAYGAGDSPVITGFDVITNWHSTGNSYRASGVFKSDYFPSIEIGMVLVDDNVILKYNPDASNLYEDEYNHNGSEGLLTIRLFGNENPSEHTIEAAIRNSCIYAEGKSYLVIEDLHLTGAVKGVGLSAANWPVLDVGSDHNIVRNNLIEYHGEKPIKLTGCSNNRIVGNTLRYAGGVQHPDYAAIGIQLDAGADGNGNGSNNNIIEENKITYSEENGILIRDSDSNIVRRNFISDIKNFHGIWNKDSDGTEIYYNVIESGPQGSAIEVEDGSSTINICNNTMPIMGEKFGVFLTENSLGTTVKNNIAVDGRAFKVVSGSEANLIANNNVWFRDNGDVVVWLGKGYTVATFVDYQNTSEQDSNSITDDPLFVNVQDKAYRLKSNSPAIDAGIDLGLKRDIVGNSIVGLPDIGAYEYVGISAPVNVRIIFQ